MGLLSRRDARRRLGTVAGREAHGGVFHRGEEVGGRRNHEAELASGRPHMGDAGKVDLTDLVVIPPHVGVDRGASVAGVEVAFLEHEVERHVVHLAAVLHHPAIEMDHVGPLTQVEEVERVRYGEAQSDARVRHVRKEVLTRRRGLPHHPQVAVLAIGEVG